MRHRSDEILARGRNQVDETAVNVARDWRRFDAALLHAPSAFTLEVDSSVVVHRSTRGHADSILAFYLESSKIESEIKKLSQMIFLEDSLWIAWPKRTSGVSTTVTDHVVREIVLPIGLVDNKVSAIDDVWTALRMQWHLKQRTAVGSK